MDLKELPGNPSDLGVSHTAFPSDPVEKIESAKKIKENGGPFYTKTEIFGGMTSSLARPPKISVIN